VNDALNSNRLSTGKYIHAFESEFARRHDCGYAVMCNSGTSALHIAVAVLKETQGWHDGDEILVPAVTFIATSNVVLHNHLKPVFVDVDPVYYNIDPSRIEEKISDRTRAILPAHLFGLPCDMDPILRIADRYGLKIIEDSCETMFARYQGRSVGSFGDMACFSTYVAHILVTGVGGLITTNRKEYATLCRSVLAHGRDAIYLSIDDDDEMLDENQRKKIIERRFSFVRLGHSFRATELEGALGLAQLAKREQLITKRRANAEYLTKQLHKFSDRLQLPSVPPHSEHSFMMYPIVTKEGARRDDLVDYLETMDIETRYMLPLLSQPIYKKIFGDIEDDYPVAKQINQNGFYIGCHQGLTKGDLDYVVYCFEQYFSSQTQHSRVSRAGGRVCVG
jgi:dTDP-4-amino-4,6-dideoxygalactose transaminase